MKVKELFEAGLWAQIAGGLAGKSAGQIDREERSYTKQQKANQTAQQSVTNTPVQQKANQTAQQSPAQLNANLDAKIAYAKSRGWIGSRPTNQDKAYLDSVDVDIDPNRFNNVDPKTFFIPHQPLHVKSALDEFSVSTVELNRALGFKHQEEFKGYSTITLTPAGWYSVNRQAYINPNSKAQTVIDMFYNRSKGGTR